MAAFVLDHIQSVSVTEYKLKDKGLHSYILNDHHHTSPMTSLVHQMIVICFQSACIVSLPLWINDANLLVKDNQII